MRFLYKRPKLDHVSEELETLMEVMVSDLFIYLDLFIFSFIFTIFLSPVIPSLTMALLFFLASYSFFGCLYYFVISKITIKK
ncbi:hypothetical protein COJ85_16445 [Bacillus sp. AFS076308]|uniref:hypothetical protein n=1 Tax=Bacillus sp. OTU2372 TaxID=3043858 RepID=UPI000BF5D97E|nr:hypothetical protein COJ85_16445 [Bacillus sp. AFS076308]PGV55594.1 hypothetical protein COD92_01365 [Bacillus sp. AFS037270]